jgi:hypothetical protein
MSQNKTKAIDTTGACFYIEHDEGCYKLEASGSNTIEVNLCMGIYQTEAEAKRALARIAEQAENGRSIAYL